MAFSQVQAKNNSSGVFVGITSQTVSFTSANTANNLLLACISAGLNSGGEPDPDPTVSDTAGNTWTKVIAVHQITGQTNPSDTWIYAALNCKAQGAGNVVTANFGSNSQNFISITIYEFTNGAGGSTSGWTADQTGSSSAGNTAASTSCTTGTTTVANEIVVGANANWTSAPTVGAGYTAGPVNSSGIDTFTEHKFISSTGAQTIVWGTATTASNSTTVGATFFVSSTGPPPVLMGQILI
jgi:hypothetical protein